MTREDYIGYLLHSLDDEATREVEVDLHRSPQARAELTLLRESLRPLEVDRDSIHPPEDLADRTLATIAHYVVETYGRAPGTDATPVADFLRGVGNAGPILPSTIYPSDASDFEEGPTFHRANVVAACGLALVVFALLLPAILFLRDRQNSLACQQKLSTLHQSLMTYADTFKDNLPRVGEGETGMSFVSTLQRNGFLPADMTLVCPNAPTPTANPGVPGTLPRLIDYAYNFGYRDAEGNLVGLRRDEVDGQTALLSDAPSPGQARCLGETAPVNHSKGQNVLFLNGSVQFCSHTALGNDDNIFCNQQRQNKAGVNRFDVMLGRGDEVP
jgi:hypothetical protein